MQATHRPPLEKSRSFFRIGFLLFSSLSLAGALSGCGTLGLGYLVQAGKGQMELMNRARPMKEVLADPRTSLRLKALLEKIPEIKAYGESQGLRPTRNYVDYVALDRDSVSYVVSASSPLKFEPQVWSFPIVGSFTYVGWFDRASAEAYAAELAKGDLDVDVRGAPAFSTLGWFEDPVVSSMIAPGDEALGELAEVLLHESVHTTLYISGQSNFNESLADFVARKLTPRYLAARFGENSVEARAYGERLESSAKAVALLRKAYLDLKAVYDSSSHDDDKRKKKQEILTALDAHFPGRRPWNNAALIQFKTYGSGRAAFEALWKRVEEKPDAFLARLRVLADGRAFPSSQMDDFDPVVQKLLQ